MSGALCAFSERSCWGSAIDSASPSISAGVAGPSYFSSDQVRSDLESLIAYHCESPSPCFCGSTSFHFPHISIPFAVVRDLIPIGLLAEKAR